MKRIIRWFATGPDSPAIGDPDKIHALFQSRRLRVFVWLVLGYGFFYTCRLSLSVAKKPMLDEGVLSVEQMGIIGSMLLFVYAFGKFFNGFLADRANIRRFMSIALLCSAFANLLFGSVSNFALFAILWAFNGWFQSIGSAPSVVSICQWFSNRERGTRYGVWAGAHNIGEGLTFVGTALIVNAFGWRWGFWGPGIVCVIVAVILYINLADRPQTYGLPNVADYKKDYSAGKPTEASTGSLQLLVLKSPIVWVLGLSSACMYMARYAINSWAIFYLQEGKGYELVEAASAMAAYPIFGLLGAVFSGFLSDRFFGARRNVPTLLYGLLLIGSMCLFYYAPPGHILIDTIALAAFGFAIGGLIVFLAGLIAVDLMPVGAAGAVKGVIGLFSYLGAASQDWISGVLIENTKTVVDGVTTYSFDTAFYFWISASVVSMLLALFAWNKKPHE
ncbi:MAG: MFS transporter [Gammaproteobacteria bacterium]|nr:MFS transporter [Gammaproteobacteria bacterium]